MSNRQLIEAFNTFVETYSDMSGRTDEVLGLHSGTDKEITLTLTMLRQAADALSAYEWREIKDAPERMALHVWVGDVLKAELDRGKWYVADPSNKGRLTLECPISPTHFRTMPTKPITGDE